MRPLTLVAYGAGALWCVGLALFLRPRRPFAVELPARLPHPSAPHDVAALEYGPTIRASSYFADVFSQHHPAFVVDRRPYPTLEEKWASARGDGSPWIEIRWRGEHAIDEVRIQHAGVLEPADLSARAYRIRCLAASGSTEVAAIAGNTEPRAVHRVDCPRATGVRIDFTPNSAGELTRVFEIEAWGQ